MNTLISINEQFEYQLEKKESSEEGFFGDILAYSIIGFYTLFSFVVGVWSILLFLTGSFFNGGPIELLFDLVKLSGLV